MSRVEIVCSLILLLQMPYLRLERFKNNIQKRCDFVMVVR
jgi:hypothetical protein